MMMRMMMMMDVDDDGDDDHDGGDDETKQKQKRVRQCTDLCKSFGSKVTSVLGPGRGRPTKHSQAN